MVTSLAAYKIIVTRPVHQARKLLSLLKQKGFSVVACPLIRIERIEPDQNIMKTVAAVMRGECEWLIFTSANGVRNLAELQNRLCMKVVLPEGVRVAAQGWATAEAFGSVYGKQVNLIPQVQTGEGLLGELCKFDLSGKRVVLVQGAGSRQTLAMGLRHAGALVESLVLHRAVSMQMDQHLAAELSKCNRDKLVFLFFSPSAVRSMAAYDYLLHGSKIAVIGPVTGAAVRELGYEVFLEALQQSDEGLVAVLQKVLSGKVGSLC